MAANKQDSTQTDSTRKDTESNTSNEETQDEHSPPTIQTAQGSHTLNEDNPVRTGNFSQIDKYHTTKCRYITEANPKNIRPLLDQELTFHESLEECSYCKKNRNNESPTSDNGDRSYYNLAKNKNNDK